MQVLILFGWRTGFCIFHTFGIAPFVVYKSAGRNGFSFGKSVLFQTVTVDV